MSKSRNHRIEVSLLGSGYAAIMTAEYQDMNWNRDVVQTGIGRYRTKEEAIKEAEDWSEAEEVEFHNAK